MLLENAGVPFEIVASEVDEEVIKDAYASRDLGLEETTLALARAKADLVSHMHPDAYVIGGDQILGLDGKGYDKPTSRQQAANQLQEFSGKTHYLHTSVCVIRGGSLLWSDTASPALSMRVIGPEEVKTYLSRVDEAVFSSVGAYQLEGPGVRLFDRVEGDYFSVLGLPLLPLLAFFRQHKLLDF